jgi:hypothetical protein
MSWESIVFVAKRQWMPSRGVMSIQPTTYTTIFISM